MEKKKLDVSDIGDAKFQIKLAILSCIVGLSFLAFGILGVKGSLAFLGFDYWFYVFTIVGGSIMNVVTIQPTIKNIKAIRQSQTAERAEKNAKTIIMETPYVEVSEKPLAKQSQGKKQFLNFLNKKHKTKENNEKDIVSEDEQPTK